MAGATDGTGARAREGAVAPTWLAEVCPAWCTRIHREDDHPEDRYHQSEPSTFPAVAGAGDDVPLTDSLRAMTLGVRLGRHLGDDRTWLVVESLDDRHPRAVLTRDAAGALIRHLVHQLSLADADPA